MRKIRSYSFTFALMKRFAFHSTILSGLLTAIICFGIASSIEAQSNTKIASEEDSLRILTSVMWKPGPDSIKQAACYGFLDRLSSLLTTTEGYTYPFDSLQGISVQSSDDGFFRIFSWDLPLNSGRNLYYGLISTRDLKIFRLLENARQSGWEDKIIDVSNWYGCLYYKVITQKYKSVTWYILLGWDGNSKQSDLKLIDIISFKNDGQISFGAPVFKTAGGLKNRVIFEYAKRGNAILRYDRQSLLIAKGNRIQERKLWMIIADHLEPMSPGLEGQYKYYVPSGDTYDGYFFSKGFWLFAENVKVGNSQKGKNGKKE